MEVILKQSVERLGKPLDIITVKDGYARNFLIPKGLAVVATKGNKKMVSMNVRIKEQRLEKEMEVAKKQAKKIDAMSLTIPVKVGEDDKMFGSVTTSMIADVAKAEGIEINKKDMVLKDPIKEIGVYNIPVKLSKGIEAKIKVWIVKEA